MCAPFYGAANAVEVVSSCVFCCCVRSDEQAMSAPYDRGLFQNIRTVYGDCVLCWALPTAPMRFCDPNPGTEFALSKRYREIAIRQEMERKKAREASVDVAAAVLHDWL